MSQAKAYICVVLMRHESNQENRVLTDLVVATDEEQALVRAALLAHPGGHDQWSVLSREVRALDEETLERAAAEVLGWSKRAEAGKGAS